MTIEFMSPVKNGLPADFTLRPATMDDIPAVVALLNACSMAAVGITEQDENEMTLHWKTDGLNLSDDSRLIFAPDGRLAAVATVWMARNPPVHPWVLVRVHPDFTGLGLGTALTQWSESRARTAIARVPAGVRVSMRCGVAGSYPLAVQFLENYGMTVVRHFWDMEIIFDGAPPAPKLPAGITIQRFRHPQDLERTYLAFDEAFEDHWGHVSSPPEEAIARWRKWLAEDPDFDPDVWFLAMDGDEIAGISLCNVKTAYDPDIAWVEILGVRRPWRKMGLGLALLYHPFNEFYRRGKKGVGLAVDAASLTGATRLYEKAGMHVVRQYTDYELELRPGKELGTS